MSFKNLKTRTKSFIDPEKVKYKVEKKPGNHGGMTLSFTQEQMAELVRLFPVTMNFELMQMFGISHSALHRIAREKGLKKDMAVIHRKHAAQIKRTCRRNGYYESLKGKAPSQQCIEASKKLRESGFHPMKRLQEISPVRYRNRLKRMSEERKILLSKEKRRYDIGLAPISNLPARFYAGVKYNKTEVYYRWAARKRGYVRGDSDPDKGERYAIYYTEETERNAEFEKNATEAGFQIMAKPIRRVCSSY